MRVRDFGDERQLALSAPHADRLEVFGLVCLIKRLSRLFIATPRRSKPPLVPPDDVSIAPGYVVRIHVPRIGTLVNHVVAASELVATVAAASKA